jgi:cysteinyl-tRNA synthetase
VYTTDNPVARDLSLRPVTSSLKSEDVEALLAERDFAREARNYSVADAVRQKLTSAGVEIMDGDPLR